MNEKIIKVYREEYYDETFKVQRIDYTLTVESQEHNGFINLEGCNLVCKFKLKEGWRIGPVDFLVHNLALMHSSMKDIYNDQMTGRNVMQGIQNGTANFIDGDVTYA